MNRVFVIALASGLRPRNNSSSQLRRKLRAGKDDKSRAAHALAERPVQLIGKIESSREEQQRQHSPAGHGRRQSARPGKHRGCREKQHRQHHYHAQGVRPEQNHNRQQEQKERVPPRRT